MSKKKQTLRTTRHGNDFIADVGSSTLSICCKKAITLTNTTNDIKCYECNNCGKLSGIEDEYGRRIN